MNHRLEEARIAIRNVRRDLHNDIREYEKEKLITEDDLKRGEEDLQKLTDKYVEEIAKLGQNKEKEIMEVWTASRTTANGRSTLWQTHL